MKVETTKEKVLEAANRNPHAAGMLQMLFPEAFEDIEIFCEVGAVFFRTDYPKNFYAVIKKGGNVEVMNITHSTTWDPKKQIKLHELKCQQQKHVTVGEFKKLTGYTDLKNFVVVPLAFNTTVQAFVIEAKDTYLR